MQKNSTNHDNFFSFICLILCFSHFRKKVNLSSTQNGQTAPMSGPDLLSPLQGKPRSV